MATVLIVDNDIARLGSLGLLIAADGHLVRTATSGCDALSLALEHPPDVVVTDWTMQGREGSPLVQEMRQVAALASIPVILTSGARRRHVEGFAFRRKPFPVTHLLHQLHRLHRHRSTRTAGLFVTKSREVLMLAASYISAIW